MATTPSSSRRDPSESSAANSDSVTTPRDIPPVVPKLDGLEPKWHDGPSSTKLTTCLLQHFVFSLYIYIYISAVQIMINQTSLDKWAVGSIEQHVMSSAAFFEMRKWEIHDQMQCFFGWYSV